MIFIFCHQVLLSIMLFSLVSLQVDVLMKPLAYGSWRDSRREGFSTTANDQVSITPEMQSQCSMKLPMGRVGPYAILWVLVC